MNAPLFPFGFGLSYTSFSYSDVKVDRHTISAQDLAYRTEGKTLSRAKQVRVTATVRNSGPVAGTEVVQLYVRNVGGSIEQPVRELKGFTRVTLAPGQAKQVEFSLGFGELSHYNLQMEPAVEPSDCTVWVGGSSEAEQSASFQITP